MILNFYKQLLGQFSFDTIGLLLNNNLHYLLIQGLNCYDNSCIVHSLESLKVLLARIEESGEEGMLNEVVKGLCLKYEMEKLG